ncbi:serine/threonine/tyrosine-interacting protein-like isoform X2 [Lycorma delicatula]
MVSNNEEWTYTMRRKMQEIVPGVYLGPYSSAMRTMFQVLKEHGITHIICVREKIEAHFIRPNFPNDFRYLVLDIADNLTQSIIPYIIMAKDFIEESLLSGGKTLVHGNAGISRSAALVLGYIMQKYGLSLRRAFQVVQQKRFCINPNEGFMAQLSEFEPIYKAQLINQHGQTSAEICHRNKRPLDCVDDR